MGKMDEVVAEATRQVLEQIKISSEFDKIMGDKIDAAKTGEEMVMPRRLQGAISVLQETAFGLLVFSIACFLSGFSQFRLGLGLRGRHSKGGPGSLETGGGGQCRYGFTPA